MAEMLTITVNGRELPCRITMGAMLRYRDLTGREIGTVDASELSEQGRWLWCCVASACNRAGEPFDMTLVDFLDCVTPDDLVQWSLAQAEAARERGASAKGKKKA